MSAPLTPDQEAEARAMARFTMFGEPIAPLLRAALASLDEARADAARLREEQSRERAEIMARLKATEGTLRSWRAAAHDAGTE